LFNPAPLHEEKPVLQDRLFLLQNAVSTLLILDLDGVIAGALLAVAVLMRNLGGVMGSVVMPHGDDACIVHLLVDARGTVFGHSAGRGAQHGKGKNGM
jgi:hypothetical protein